MSKNVGIKFGSKTFTNAKQLSQQFNKIFSNAKTHTADKRNRILLRKFRKLDHGDNIVISDEMVRTAIRMSKNSRAAGPDDITIFHLKHLGPNGIRYLANIFNTSLARDIIPAVWKQSTIIPLLKPGKAEDECKSYRPVSLLSPTVKVLEKCLLTILQQHLPAKDHQHGFRPGHSTTTALTKLVNQAIEGFNNKPADRTIVVALDLTKAFDMVTHRLLLEDLLNTSLPRGLLRWLGNYLHGRQARTSFRGEMSQFQTVYMGVPQGSIISPTLFNYYVSNAPVPPPNIKVVSYADDFTVYSSGTVLEKLEREINQFIPTLVDFFETRGLAISTSKSSATILTLSTGERKFPLKIKVHGQPVPIEHHPKILGVTLDPSLSFKRHAVTEPDSEPTFSRLWRVQRGVKTRKRCS